MIFKALARWILKDDIKSNEMAKSCFEREIKHLEESNQVLRLDSDQLKDCQLKLRIAEMYVDDDDALLELVGMAVEHEKKSSTSSYGLLAQQLNAARCSGNILSQSQARALQGLGAAQGTAIQGGIAALLGQGAYH